jgi:hypothetical protein
MSKPFSTNRSTRRRFLRTTVIGATGLALVEFGMPRKAWAGTYSSQISQSSDDATETPLGSMHLSFSTLNFKDTQSAWVGLRFQNVTVPTGSTIASATLTWDLAVAPRAATQEVQIHGELPGSGSNGNSVTFAATANNISTRKRTTSYTAWNIPTMTGTYNISSNWSGDSGGSNLSAVIQEIINNSNGWASGNALSIIVDTNLSTLDAEIEAWDGSHTNAAQLSVSY